MTRLKIKRFARNDAGSLTVDWIVLTAALVGLAVVMIASIQAGDHGLAANLGSYVTDHDFY